MNRRKMLTLSAGILLGGVASTVINAQESPLWFIHEDEFKTNMVLPNSKKRNKAVVTNRFDQALSRYEKIIRIAEALYPYYILGSETENGKPLWYSDGNRKVPYNVTPKAVNYYVNLALANKDSGTKYNVEVNEFLAVTEEKRKNLQLPEEVYEVSLILSYGSICGFLCGGGFELRKKVFFNQQDEIMAFYMPNLTEWVS